MADNADKAPRRPRGPVAVLVADDHPAMRRIVKELSLEREDLEVVGEAADGAAALEQCRRLHPDVLVLDLGLPKLSGLNVVRALRADADAPRVLVFTSRDDAETLLECHRVGVEGFIDKSADWSRLADAIAEVAAGGRAFDPGQQQGAMERLGDFARRSRDGAAAHTTVTARERDVLSLLAEGLTTRQVGASLGLSFRTVESHISKLYRKLGVHNRVQGVARGRELNLLDREMRYGGPRRGAVDGCTRWSTSPLSSTIFGGAPDGGIARAER